MIKIQKAPISFIYNKPNTNHYLVCYAPEDGVKEVFKLVYQYIKCNLKRKNVKKC
ncbi:MAG: hypothetical protein HFF36_09690 [Coprobacillus sp.]|nr:hypothetical protein [Coprobacillus sp.]